jgi:hypothetical protein
VPSAIRLRPLQNRHFYNCNFSGIIPLPSLALSRKLQAQLGLCISSHGSSLMILAGATGSLSNIFE